MRINYLVLEKRAKRGGDKHREVRLKDTRGDTMLFLRDESRVDVDDLCSMDSVSQV